MIRSIMVPLDGSRFAETALAAARSLARSAHARLHLVLVREPEPQPGAADRGEAVPEARYLADAASRLRQTADCDCEIRHGEVAVALADGVRDVGADLVIMASHGRGALPSPKPCSVAEALMRTAPAPILLVGRGDPAADRVAHPRSVLAPVDLAREPGQVSRALVDFACVTQAHVTLLHVLLPAGAGDLKPAGAAPVAARPRPRPADDRRSRAQQRLDRLADQLRALGVRAAARVVEGADVAATILKELARGPADLVVMCPRPGGGTEPDRPNGVTSAVLRAATKPVLVVPGEVPVPA